MKNSSSLFRNGKYGIWLDLLLMVGVGFTIVVYFLTNNQLKGSTDEFVVSNGVFSVLISILLYFFFRMMFLFLDARFPWSASIKKRLWVEIPLVFLISAGVMWGFMVFWYWMHNRELTAVALFSNITIAILVSLLLNLVFEGANIFRLYRQTAVNAEVLKRRTLESHYETLKNQVGPHFLFNSLNTLQALIDENPEMAKDFVQNLATYYRYAMQVNAQDSVPLSTEIDLVKNYLFLLSSRFGNNLKTEFRISDSARNCKVIPLAIQLLVENALKHNVVSSAKPLSILISDEGNDLLVRNNLQRKEVGNQSNKLGLENIRNRYQLLGFKGIIVHESDAFFEVRIPLIHS